MTDKPGDDDEAKADEANEVEADEADAKVDEAVEVIVTKEIESNVIDEIIAADEAIVIDEVIAVDEAILIDEVIADEAILDNAANEAIVANEADDSDDEADGVLDNQLAELEKKDVEKVSRITVHLCCCW